MTELARVENVTAEPYRFTCLWCGADDPACPAGREGAADDAACTCGLRGVLAGEATP